MLKRIDVAPHLDPLVELALHISSEHSAQLPNLGKTTIILPDLAHSKALRKALIDSVPTNALILPQMQTLRQWACEKIENPLPIINNHGRELMMVEVLRQHPEVFGEGTQSWSLADELLVLFDELNLSNFNADNFLQRFQQGDSFLSKFSADAQKIQILWQARDQHLQQEGVTDRNTLYRNALHNLLSKHYDDCYLYLVGMDSLTALELKALRECPWLHATEISQINDPAVKEARDQPALTTFFDTAFAYQNGSLLERATQFRQAHESSPCADTGLVAAGSREEEAAVIDLQIRHWLIAGKQRISVVTEDRLLARRVSALLNRASLEIHDSAGWPLSTTRAAGTVEHWLLSIENDFHSLHLLDLLKSGFLQLSDSQLKSLHLFEKHIIAQERIYFSIEDYLTAIKRYKNKKGDDNKFLEIATVLERLEKAAQPLIAICDGDSYQADEFIEATLTSFKMLEIDQVLADDPAGRRILQELEDMRQGLAQRDLRINWSDYRGWFGRAMETHNFRPDLNPGGVTISNYQQSILGNFDAVIIAGCDQKALPKKPTRQGIFNNDVRYELGLRNWRESRKIIQNRFRRLLQAAPAVLLTYTSETARGPQLPSAWVTILESFHKTLWENSTLQQSWQLQAVRAKKSEPAIEDNFPLPKRKPRARARLTASRLPKQISASQHQALIDCPYKFFSASALEIRAWDTFDPEIRKRDFGQLVHTCLQQFHTQVATIKDRKSAIDILTTISEVIFQPIIEQQIVNHGWWNTWKIIIPHYVEWQKSWQDKDWAVDALEKRRTIKVAGATNIVGVLDRIDKCGDQRAIFDYKTGGKTPLTKIKAGEDVQLLTYGMLVDGITDLLYLYVGNKEKIDKTHLAPKDFPGELIEKTAARLTDILERLKNGSKLPAWGHEDVCKHCDFIGLCRKGSWQDSAISADAT